MQPSLWRRCRLRLPSNCYQYAGTSGDIYIETGTLSSTIRANAPFTATSGASGGLDGVGSAGNNFTGRWIQGLSGAVSTNDSVTFSQDGGITAGVVDVRP